MLRSLRKDTYHELLTCSWLKFSGFLILAFLGLNVFFSFIFVISDGSFVTPDHLRAYPRFVAGLFLSVQTLSTIGYGGMLPTSLVGEVVAAFESLIGLMFTALAGFSLEGRIVAKWGLSWVEEVGLGASS